MCASKMFLKIAVFCGVTSLAIVIVAFNGLWYRSPRIDVVCPEYYAGPNHKSETKWQIKGCDYEVPMTDLVTIILFYSDLKMASVIQKSLPGVTVIMPGYAQPEEPGSIKYVRTPVKAKPGEIWNTMINACDTPYALLAANVLNVSMDHWALQRLVRVLSKTEGTAVVGGATRNSTGYWRAGCYQVTMTNYILTYQKGYHQSVNECMRCDHLDGPFLAETKLLKSVLVDNELPAKMVFPDFFLKVFRSQKSLLCPDVMLDADDLLMSPEAANRGSWKSLAARWQLNRIHIRLPRSAILHKFNCTEVGLRCGVTGDAKTLPVCCQEELARAIDFWSKFAKDNDVSYQFHSRSILGAVKMDDVLPWGVDGDMNFDRENFSFVQSSSEAFKKADIGLVVVKNPSNGTDFRSWGYMEMWVSGMVIQMHAVPLSRIRATPDKAESSKMPMVDIHGVFVTAPLNPGRYARGRYGKDFLKHGASWRQLRDPDNSGNCGATCHVGGCHACLDAMPTDGSIYYNVPEY